MKFFVALVKFSQIAGETARDIATAISPSGVSRAPSIAPKFANSSELPRFLPF